MTESSLHRLTAFSDRPTGGNPAGVWIGSRLPTPEEMQQVAAEVGFSETAFVAPVSGSVRTIRFFSPQAEVSFCGHATIATGVLLGSLDGAGTYRLQSAVGEVPVVVRRREGRFEASLTSVDTEQREPGVLLPESLASLGWTADELDPAIPPVLAWAGAWHLVLAVSEERTLAALDYDFERLRQAMLAADTTTLQLIWRERSDLFHSRNPFPVGGVVEDAATGAAAAALGGYLRDSGLIQPPAAFEIRQGEAMGRPSRLRVEVPPRGGIVVSGTAVPLDPEPEPSLGGVEA